VAFPLAVFNQYVFFQNETNHMGGSAYILFLALVPVAFASFRKLKDGKKWLIPFSIATGGTLNVAAFDALHVMESYDSWIQSGMPERPAWSLIHGCATDTRASPFLNATSVAGVLDFPAGQIESKVLQVPLNVAPSITIPATFSVTSKGNGSLQWKGGLLRVYDDHDDGVVYYPRLLKNELRDTNGDGYKDIVVSGAVTLMGDEPSQHLQSISVRTVLTYDPHTMNFLLFEGSPYVYVSVQSNQPLQPTR
jgi:hypothetical protein